MKYNGYAIPSTTPWITSKRLKRAYLSEDYIKHVKFIDTHDFDIEIKGDNVIVSVKEKYKHV